MKTKCGILLYLLFFLPSFSLFSQTNTFQIWLDYDQKNKINSKWDFIADYGIRSDFEEWMRYHGRAAFVLNPGKKLSYYGGLGLFYLTNFNSFNTIEIRPWQGFLISAPDFGRFNFKNYFRLEERLVFGLDNSYTNFTLKLRYKLGLKIPINEKTIKDKTFYVPISFELFFNLAFSEEPINNDRIRFEIGLGYRISEKTNVTLLYTLQEVYFKENNYIDFGEGFINIDNIVRITLSQRFNND